MIPTLVLSDSFLKSFAELPQKMQNKVRHFIEKFRENPTSSAINYERIHEVKDPNLRSVRIDLAYRGIVLKPSKGDVYMLLWVDHHDEAYQWAMKRQVSIHPRTGSLQIVQVIESVAEVTPSALPASTHAKPAGLFSAANDEDLLQLGVPPILLPLVRSIADEAALDEAASYFPAEASEALYALGAGMTLADIVTSRALAQQAAPAAVIDTEDFSRSLAHPDSQRRFVVVEDEAGLEALLDAPLAQWRVFLHPAQRALAQLSVKGPVRVLGGAGTGKTVVALHRAKWLAEQLQAPGEKVLFTTFTRNLATDIQHQLGQICGPDTLSRIEVINLDAWVQQFLSAQGFGYKLDYQSSPQERAQLWQQALCEKPAQLEFPDRFYAQEWEQVILAKGVTHLRDYYKVSRHGRGWALNRSERMQIWPVFESYRQLLRTAGLCATDDAYREARLMLAEQGRILPYRHLVLDETQDMGEQALQLLRQMVPHGPNDLFLVGDGHQRIYRGPVVLAQCGIDIRGKHHSHRLTVNYRTTDEIRRWAVGLLSGWQVDDLDGGQDSAAGYRSLRQGPAPEVQVFASASEELAHLGRLLEHLQQQDIPLEHICLVARNHEQLQSYQQAIEARYDIPVHPILPRQADEERHVGLRTATLHRVKGLEFDVVIAAGLNAGVMPPSQRHEDEDGRLAAELRERALLYVGATRARKRFYATAYGTPSPLLATAVQ